MRNDWVTLKQIAVPLAFARCFATFDDTTFLCELRQAQQSVGRVGRWGDVGIDLESGTSPANLL